MGGKDHRAYEDANMIPQATIFNIQRDSCVDGLGVRKQSFQNYNLRCAWCHNFENQSAKPQTLIYKSKHKQLFAKIGITTKKQAISSLGDIALSYYL